ncbi:DUF58 domain-containing protein [bacterium]|nr:DUF58 domain-containing protein [bacterium]
MPPNASTGDVGASDVASALRLASAPAFLRTLDRLRFASRHSVGQHPGSTPISRITQPGGHEIAAHKPYAPGDDLRHVDWNALARLDQRVVKTFRAEREAPLHLLLDASGSMNAPAADGKFPFAVGLAASLAYVALRHGNPVRLALLGGRDGARLAPLLRHVQRLPELHQFLAPAAADGPTRLLDGLRAYLRTTRLPGTAVVVSDFLVEPTAYEATFDELLGHGYDAAAIRVIGPHERSAADLPRRLRLRDAETGRERIVELTAALRHRYADAVDQHLAGLRRWCAARAVVCAAADTAGGLDGAMLRELPRAGLLQ